MKYERIITEQIVNSNTGEIEDREFKETMESTGLRGGFTMMYQNSYEQIQIDTLKSNRDIELFHWITHHFTARQTESKISYKGCKVKISRPSFMALIKRLVDEKYLMRVDKSIYRLNPYVYLPYRADGPVLQAEWQSIAGFYEQEQYTIRKHKSMIK